MQYNRLQQKGQTYEAAQNFSEPKKGKNDLQLISQRWVFGVAVTRFFVYFELDFYCLCSFQKSSSK